MKEVKAFAVSLKTYVFDDHQGIGNIDVRPFAHRKGFYSGLKFDKPVQECTRLDRFTVGFVAMQLGKEVDQICNSWLKRCDQIMCSVFSDYCDNRAERNFADNQVDEMCEFLSTRLAGRIALIDEEALNQQILRERAQAEYVRTKERAKMHAQDTLIALKSLRALCEKGFGATESKERFDHIQFLIEFQPPELDGVESGDNHEEQMNLPLLAHACSHEVEMHYRQNFFHHWSRVHGAFTFNVATHAIQKVKAWLNGARCVLLNVVQEYDSEEYEPSHRVPWAKFYCMESDLVFAAPPGPPPRTGLDFAGRRVVRLASFVASLFDRDELKHGHISEFLLGDVASTTNEICRNVLRELQLKKDTLNEGCRLLHFCFDISSLDGDLYQDMNNAFCHVSMFSYLEMHSVFGRHSPVLPRIIDKFSRLTRENMSCTVSEAYYGLVDHAVSYVIPLIEKRRSLINRPLSFVPNAISEALLTIPKVKQWHPLQGTLRIDKNDLDIAVPFVWSLFESLHRRKYLIKMCRPMIHGVRATTTNIVFDTNKLYSLLYGA